MKLRSYGISTLPWFKTIRCDAETSFSSLPCIWLLSKKGKNCVFVRLKFVSYLKNVPHKRCENALKAFLYFFCLGKDFSIKIGVQVVQEKEICASGLNENV